MSLIQLLQESSTLDIQTLKKAMMKDKHSAQIFTKNLKLEDILDKEAFLSTVKYYVLNNLNVRKFVEMRDNVKLVSKYQLTELRQLRASTLKQSDVEALQEFMSDLVKEHSSVGRTTLSGPVRKELEEWINNSGRYYSLKPWAEAELLSIPQLRPNKRVLVYRGLLFSEHSFGERTSYNGSVEVGTGLQFIRGIKAGGREVDVTWDRASSWTVNKEVATRFAQNGPASNHTSAMLGWLSNAASGRKIDGQLGYVVATFADPKDIIIDTTKVAIASKYGGEGEIILKPGTYKSRIVKKYTVGEGEVNPDVAADISYAVVPALAAVEAFAEKFKLPSDMVDLPEMQYVHLSESTRLVEHPDLLKALVTNSLTTQILHTYDELLDFYRKELSSLTAQDVALEQFANNEALRKRVSKLLKVRQRFEDSAQHAKFKGRKKNTGPIYELSAEDIRTTISPFDLEYLEQDLLTQGFIRDGYADRSFTKLAGALKVDLPGSTGGKMRMFGAAKQQPIIKEVVEKFFKLIDVSVPESDQEALRSMIGLIKKAYRNFVMLDRITGTDEDLREI